MNELLSGSMSAWQSVHSFSSGATPKPGAVPLNHNNNIDLGFQIGSTGCRYRRSCL